MASESMKNVYRALAVLASVLVGLFLFVRFISPYLTPFIIAAVLAFLMDPVVNFLERKGRMPRGLAVFLVLALVVLFLSFFVVIGIAQIQTELSKLRTNLPGYLSRLAQDIQGLFDDITRTFSTLPGPVSDFIAENTKHLASRATEVLNSAVDFLAKIPSWITVFLVSILATYFISKDKTRVTSFLFEFLPEKQRMSVRRVEYQIMGAVVRLIRAQLLLMAITGLLTIVGLSILRVSYAWLIGILIGLLDVLPMIGAATLLLPWGIYSIFTGHVAFGLALLVLLGIQMLIRQIAEAKIVGKSIGVHPLATLLSIYVGYRVFGFGGFILGPVIAVALKAIIAEAIIPTLTHGR